MALQRPEPTVKRTVCNWPEVDSRGSGTIQSFGSSGQLGKQGALEYVVSGEKAIFSFKAAPVATGIRDTNIPGGVGLKQNGTSFYHPSTLSFCKWNSCQHTPSTPCYVVVAELCQSSPYVSAQPGR